MPTRKVTKCSSPAPLFPPLVGDVGEFLGRHLFERQVRVIRHGDAFERVSEHRQPFANKRNGIELGTALLVLAPRAAGTGPVAFDLGQRQGAPASLGARQRAPDFPKQTQDEGPSHALVRHLANQAGNQARQTLPQAGQRGAEVLVGQGAVDGTTQELVDFLTIFVLGSHGIRG